MEAIFPNLHPLSPFTNTEPPSFSFSIFTTNAHKHNYSPSFSSSKPRTRHTSLPQKKGAVDFFEKTVKLNLQVSPHRAVAAVRLMRIEFGGAFADLLNEKGKGSGKNEMAYVERTLGFCTRDLDERDIRLSLYGFLQCGQLEFDAGQDITVTDIVGGTIRWRKYLDYLILSLCHNESTFRSMEPLLLQILRIGFYEIVKLETPPYAVVDENVNLAKYALRPGAGNMVNGILRKLVSLKDNGSLPSPELGVEARKQARALAIMYSHPVWMVRRWTKYLGQEEAIKLMIWNNSNPCFSLRSNIGKGFTRNDLIEKLDMLKVSHEPSLHLDDFIRVKSGMQIVIQSGLLKEGLCSVQDESAGLAVSVLDPQPGDRIMDCCAAPGGKTLFMASRLNDQGMISAVDINRGRVRILQETAKLQCLDNVISCIHADVRNFPDVSHAKFNKVLLDAPCSGLGVLAKRSDLRWNRRLEDLEELKTLQDELLDAASKLVETDGVLVYSTCSIDYEENEERVAAFLVRHPEFQIDPVHRYVPSDFLTDEGFFRSCPVTHSMDGAFAARLVRKPYGETFQLVGSIGVHKGLSVAILPVKSKVLLWPYFMGMAHFLLWEKVGANTKQKNPVRWIDGKPPPLRRWFGISISTS